MRPSVTPAPFLAPGTCNGFGPPGKRPSPAGTATRSMAISPRCMTWLPGGRRRGGISTGLVGRCACSGWTCQIGKIPSRPSSGARPTRARLTNAPGASGAASCGMRRRTSRTQRPWRNSSSGRAPSTPVPVGSLGGWGEVIDPEPSAIKLANLTSRPPRQYGHQVGGAGWRCPAWRLLPQKRV
jgi:hypothetical protein